MQFKIDLKIFIFIIIFYLTKQIQIYSIIMLFATIRELGHLVMGIVLGFKPRKIELMPLGLSIAFKVDSKYYNQKIKNGTLLSFKRLIVAIAGPVTNFILAIIFCNLNIINELKEQIIYSNLLIGLFNLIPIYPMDGGRIVKEIVHIFKGFRKSTILTNEISNISIVIITAFSSIGIYYLKNIGILFILVYLWAIVLIENKKYRIKRRVLNLIN